MHIAFAKCLCSNLGVAQCLAAWVAKPFRNLANKCETLWMLLHSGLFLSICCSFHSLRHTHTHTHTNTNKTHTHTHTRARARMYLSIYIYMYIYIYIYIYIYDPGSAAAPPPPPNGGYPLKPLFSGSPLHSVVWFSPFPFPTVVWPCGSLAPPPPPPTPLPTVVWCGFARGLLGLRCGVVRGMPQHHPHGAV